MIERQFLCRTVLVRKTLSFQKCGIFIDNGLSELIQQPRFTHTAFGYNRKCLPATFFSPLKSVQQQLEFTISSNEGCKASFGADIKSCSSGARSNCPVDLNRLLLAFDYSFTQSFKPKEALGEFECVLCYIGRSPMSPQPPDRYESQFAF